MADTIEDWGIVDQSIVIGSPARDLYDIWRDLESLPRILSHVKSVREETPTQSHWIVEGPLGTDVAWDSVITQDIPGKRLSWKSTEDADVDNEGMVEFDDVAMPGHTRMHVRMVYRPPAGALGKAVAKLFGKEPNGQVEEDLKRFKEEVESNRFTSRPVSL